MLLMVARAKELMTKIYAIKNVIYDVFILFLSRYSLSAAVTFMAYKILVPKKTRR